MSPATPRMATRTPSLPPSTPLMSSQVQGTDGMTLLIALRASATGSPEGRTSLPGPIWLPSSPPSRPPSAYQAPAPATSAAASRPPTSNPLFDPLPSLALRSSGVGGGGGAGGSASPPSLASTSSIDRKSVV